MPSDRAPSLRSLTVVARPPATHRPDDDDDPARAPSRAAIESALDRIVGSTTFRRSQRHRTFLRHVVRAALDDEQEPLKEVIIGLEVFGRSLASYDPRRDPIVRVEAGRLRDKLVRFYATEGYAEALELSIPVGGYLPRWARRAIPSTAPTVRSAIAILPFINLSGHVDDDNLSIGLADQLIDTLGRVPGLQVVARVSALEAGGRELPLQTVGRLLGVGYVVEGSVQRSGDRIRCMARFSRAKDGVRIWSDRFDEADATHADLFALQDRIADAVRGAVATTLRPALAIETPALATASQSREARQLLDRARRLTLPGSIDGYRQAIVLLEDAIALDERFAQAHSHLGAARAMLGPYLFEPSFPNFARVKASALRALELDPRDGEARALLANHAYRFDRDWAGAESEFRQALRVAPSSMLVHNAYSWALLFNGRTDDAIRHARVAATLDPLNLALRAHNARLVAYAGDHDGAIRELHAVLEQDGRQLYARLALGIVHLSRGAHEMAMPFFDDIVREIPDHATAQLHRICVWGLRGEIAQGRAALRSLLAGADTTGVTPVFVALAQACLGESDAALASLDEAARTHDYLTVSIPYHPLFDRYRDEPDYRAFLARHGLRPRPS